MGKSPPLEDDFRSAETPRAVKESHTAYYSILDHANAAHRDASALMIGDPTPEHQELLDAAQALRTRIHGLVPASHR
jgi:hypothetical protein